MIYEIIIEIIEGLFLMLNAKQHVCIYGYGVA